PRAPARRRRHRCDPARCGGERRAGASDGNRATHARGGLSGRRGSRRVSVHDLGYRRYAGPRRTGGQLWRVIARRGLGSAMRSWWVIIALAIVLIVLVFGGLALYVTLKFGSDMSRVTGLGINLTFFYVGKADRYLGEAVALIIGSSVLTDDFRTGAFAFY